MEKRSSEQRLPAQSTTCETHGSLVRLVGDRAFKRRKTVRFAFLDQSTAARRRALAEEEVRVNAALAPDTYLAVRPVRGSLEADWQVGTGPPRDDDEVVVEMRRFADADTLAARVAQGRVTADELTALGALLAQFHATIAPEAAGGAAATLARVHRNMEDLVEHRADGISADEVWGVMRPLEACCLRRAAALDQRAREGRWRDAHGDLRADHVVLDDRGVRIVDRLEFDRSLRIDDVGSDLAFLLMDLEARGSAPAARAVLAGYREAGGDPGDDELIALWSAYRATVSLKTALLRARQPGGEAAAGVARTRLAVARRLGWRTRLPLVLVVCGPPASGKSTLSRLLEDRTGLPVLSSDRLRRQAHGVPSGAVAPAQAYGEDAKVAVYRRLGVAAAEALGRQGGAIVDATMGALPWRRAFLDGLGRRSPVLMVQCQVPRAVAAARAEARRRDPATESDATPEIAARLAAVWEPLDEVAAAQHLLVRTDRPAAAAADDLERALDAASRGFPHPAHGGARRTPARE
jgi:aminoglycoside phosphotransferase family enzyme/predicted kinase